MVVTIGKEMRVSVNTAEPGKSVVSVDPDPEEVLDYMCVNQMCDGLPVIPPTESRVKKFLQHVGKGPDEVVMELPPDSGYGLSLEQLAVNSVMAGCRSDYFPVVMAVFKAVSEWRNFQSLLATTSGVSPAIIVNGPIRKRLKINCGSGCLGPGYRANATIGRAVWLTLINYAKAFPGVGTMATLAHPARYTFCFGENEEESPWEPLHVERGFEKDASTVTVIATEPPEPFFHESCKKAEDIMRLTAVNIAVPGSLTTSEAGESLVILCPEYAKAIAAENIQKQDVKKYLYENAVVSTEAWTGLRTPGSDSEYHVLQSPLDAVIVVAGGVGIISAVAQVWTDVYTHSVTKEIELD